MLEIAVGVAFIVSMGIFACQAADAVKILVQGAGAQSTEAPKPLVWVERHPTAVPAPPREQRPALTVVAKEEEDTEEVVSGARWMARATYPNGRVFYGPARSSKWDAWSDARGYKYATYTTVLQIDTPRAQSAANAPHRF